MSDILTPVPKAPMATPDTTPVPPAIHRDVIDVQATTVSYRLSREWIPTVAWSIRRTGRKGLVGIALLAAALVFFFSTHLPLVDDVRSLRSDLAQAKTAAAERASRGNAIPQDDPRRLLESLPLRTDVPKTMRTILAQADEAGLSIDSGKYDIAATRTGAITRYNVSFPVSGSYPSIRSFIDKVHCRWPGRSQYPIDLVYAG
jgi:hypothetical protein